MPKPFTIYVMQSAHTDIGYTHPQEQIALMYLDHYDRVLELCRQTANAPEAQRFKWTCETFWQVRHYLAARPEREKEFLQYVRSGQIEITASYLHFTDMIDPDAYRRSLVWATDYCRKHELPLRSVLHCDINGWPWALADLLASANIPFFCSHVHIDSATDPLGKRGSVHYHWLREMSGLRPDAPIRIPQAFWWQGPAGGRVLHWLNEHYHLGNVLGLSSNYGFHAGKTRYFLETDRLTVEELIVTARQELPRYIERLRAEGYPYDALLISTGGFFVDNAPPDGRWCELIARWNGENNDIQLRTATPGEWYDELLRLDNGTWLVRQVAWPDAWAHGLGSSTARIAQARRTQRRRATVAALVEQSGSQQAAAYLDTALEHERLALEHTFNAWSTTAWPGAPGNEFQQLAKELTFHRAELYLDEAAGTALRSLTKADSAGSQLHVYAAAPSPLPRMIHFDSGDLILNPENQMLVAADDQHYAFQQDQAGPPRFVATLPVAGLASYRLETGTPAIITNQRDNATTEIENESWKLHVDPDTGGLLSLHEQATGREWVDETQGYAFGEFIHEAVIHPQGRAAVGNLARLVVLDVAGEEMRKQFNTGVPIFERTILAINGSPRRIVGPIFDAIELNGEAKAIGRVQIAWRCYHALPVVELVLDWDKRWYDLPEAAYVAFPFATEGGQLLLETGGGFFQPGSHETGGQLPGTCPTYYTTQRAARITATEGDSLLWLPLDAPLVMTNAIDYNRWETDPWTWNGFLASMPVNHYWHTNFATSQRGHLRLRYRFISPRGLPDDEAAIRAALPVDAVGWR